MPQQKLDTPDDIRALIIGSPPPAPAEIKVTTPPGQPNYIVQFVGPLVALTIRAANTFLETLVAGLGVSATGIVPGNVWRTAVIIAVSTTAVSTIKNAVTIFSSLEKQYPLLNA